MAANKTLSGISIAGWCWACTDRGGVGDALCVSRVVSMENVRA